MLTVNADQDHALNGGKINFEVTGGEGRVALEVKLHLATLAQLGRQQNSDVRFEILECKQLWLIGGSAKFCGRFLFDGDAIDMYRCMATVIVEGAGCAGQAQAIMLCTYQIILCDVATRLEQTGMMCEVSCSLFAYKKDIAAKAQKPLAVALLDDAGYAVAPGPATWLVARASAQGGRVITDSEGQATFSLFVMPGPFESSGGFRVHVSCDWQASSDLFTSVPATSRRLEVIQHHHRHRPPAATPFPTTGAAPIIPFAPPPPRLPSPKTVPPPPPEIPDDDLVSKTRLKDLGWAPIKKDGLLQCVCCRAVRSRSREDRITHRPNCTLSKQLREATSSNSSSSSMPPILFDPTSTT